MQCQCEGGVTGWQSLVQSRFGLVNQWFDVAWRKAEAAIVVVVKLVQDRVCQFPSKTRNLIAPAALQQGGAIALGMRREGGQGPKESRQ